MVKNAQSSLKVAKQSTSKGMSDLCRNDMYVARNLAQIRKKAGVGRAAKGAARALYKHVLEVKTTPALLIAAATLALEEKKRTIKASHLYRAMAQQGYGCYVPENYDEHAIVTRKKKAAHGQKSDKATKSKKSQLPAIADADDSGSESN